MLHCVPSNISSGLASLPVSYIYTNGTADTTKLTTKRLPTGEVLDGKKTYERLVGGFTTNTMKPNEIFDLGVKMLNKLYPEVRIQTKRKTLLIRTFRDNVKTMVISRYPIQGGRVALTVTLNL